MCCVDVLEPALAGARRRAAGSRPSGRRAASKAFSASSTEAACRASSASASASSRLERTSSPTEKCERVGGAAEQNGLAGMPAAVADGDERLPCAVGWAATRRRMRRRNACGRMRGSHRRSRARDRSPGWLRRRFDDHGRAAGVRPGDGVHHAARRRAEAVAQGVAAALSNSKARKRLVPGVASAGGASARTRLRGVIGDDDQVGVVDLCGDRIQRASVKLAAGVGRDALERIDQSRGADRRIGEAARLEAVLAGLDLDAVEGGDLRVRRGDSPRHRRASAVA